MRRHGFTLIELPAVRKCKSEGFTLIELLVVVAIIALLIAILMPSLDKARLAARAVACRSTLRQYVMANEMYASEFQNRYVPVRTADGESETGHNYDPWMWNAHYLTLLGARSRINTFYDEESRQLQCPDLRQKPTRGWFSASYGMVWTWVAPAWNMRLMVHRTAIKYPAAAAEIVDGTDWHIMEAYANYVTRWNIYGENRGQGVAYRHFEGEGVNIGHFDGSTEYLRRAEAWDNEPSRHRLWVLYGQAP